MQGAVVMPLMVAPSSGFRQGLGIVGWKVGGQGERCFASEGHWATACAFQGSEGMRTSGSMCWRDELAALL